MALNEGIADLPAEIMNEAFKVIVSKAYEMQTLAQMMAPVKTGWLRDHIQVEITENSNETKTVSISCNVDYAAIVEAKQPFLGPAINQIAPTIPSALLELQRSVINVEQ
jgi:hypothetical protein